MTLLDTILKASAADASAPKEPSTRVPVVVDAATVFPKLRPVSNEPPADGASLPMRRLSGWKIPKYAKRTAQDVENISMKLKKKLKIRPKPSDRREVEQLLDSLPPETLGSLPPGGEAAQLVAEACVSFEIWEKLEPLISSGLIGRWDGFDLVGKLAEKHRPDFLCLCAGVVSDLRSSQLLVILKYFLSPSKDSFAAMPLVRKEWERQGLCAIEKATDKSLSPELTALARDSSILLMIAYDGFTSYELCLHYVFSSQHLEGLVMSTAISRLDGIEVLRLIRYFRKWLEKYERFPEAIPCLAAVQLLKLTKLEWVPSLNSVARGLSLVLDERFSYFILNTQYQEEMRTLEKIARSLASKASACCYLSNAIGKLPSN